MPSFQFTTSATAASPPVGGAIAGDLYLVGGGDPVLSSDWYPMSNLERYAVLSPTRLEALADALVSAGVTSVSGDVVGDASRYDDEYFAPSWALGVAGLEAGPYDALMVNDSRVLNDPLKSNDPAQGGGARIRSHVDRTGDRRRWIRDCRCRAGPGVRTRLDHVGPARPTSSARCSATATTTPPRCSSRNSDSPTQAPVPVKQALR